SFKFRSDSAGNNSAIGKYLKSQYRKIYNEDLKGEKYKAFAEEIFNQLSKAGYLSQEKTRDENKQDTYVYQLNIDYVQWVQGDGKAVDVDKIKNPSYKEGEK